MSSLLPIGLFPTTGVIIISLISTISSLVLFIVILIFRFNTLSGLKCELQTDAIKKIDCESNLRSFKNFIILPIIISTIILFLASLITFIILLIGKLKNRKNKQPNKPQVPQRSKADIERIKRLKKEKDTLAIRTAIQKAKIKKLTDTTKK